MDLSTATEFARAHRQGVLLTQRRDGHPQLSNIVYGVGDDGLIRISITADRAKYKNLQREPWAALYVTQDDFWAYAVLEGDAEVSPVAEATDDDTVDELVALYRSVSGEHPDWDDYRRAMVADQRAVVRLRPTRAYGMLPR
jgi:PPOX class probable F420-dependent enzyme